MHVHFHVDEREKILVNSEVNSVCPLCKTNAKIRIVAGQPYARMFGVPVGPILKKKFIYGKCGNCGKGFIKKQFTESLNHHYDELKKRTPWWMFTGMGIMVLLLAGLVFLIVYMKQQEAQDVLNPKQGDIYNVKLADKRFTLIKVNAVKNDSVYLIKCRFETDDFKGYSELYDKPYDTIVKVVPKTQIKEWYDSKFVIGVVSHDE